MYRSLALVGVALMAASCTNNFSLSLGAERVQASPVVLDVPSASPAGDSPLTPSSSSTSAAPTTTLAPEPIVLGFAGDVQMVGSMAARQPLAAVSDLLSAPDLMFVNLETVIAESGEVGRPPIDKEFIFLSPPETLDQLVAAGVDVVGLANNHVWDYGPGGATATRARVDASALIGTGAGADLVAAFAPQFIEVDSRTVGVVSLSRVPCDWSRETTAERPEVAWACDRFAIAAISAIVRTEDASDITVVMLHGGVEVTNCPSERLREVIDVWIAVGADIISISHPHVLQGVEMVDGAAVLWSTGNFAFQNGGGRTARSAVFEVTIGDSIEQIRAIPTVLPGAIAGPADDETAARIRAEISERSIAGRIDDGGVLVADDSPSLCG